MLASKCPVLALALLYVALLATATALPVGHQVLGTIPQHRLRRVEQARVRHPALTNIGTAAAYSAAAPPVVYPTDFGADPTGKTDSTAAMLKALNATLALGSGRSLSNGIRDLGGATLDLGGGDYLISQPLAIPQNVGNLRVVRGTLRATPSFPPAGYLVTVGAAECGNSQHSCNENVGFENLMLDGSLVAAGCLQIGATMGAVVGPQMFFLGFNKAGITVVGGHETMISDAWLGQFLYSDPRKENGQATTANGIELLGNDHYVTNTIVFSAKVGVLVKGAANLLVGVHTWNLATPNGGIGVLVDAPGYTQNRVVASYMDYNALVAIDPQLLTVQECFFLVGSSIVIQASPQSHSIQGLVIVDNEFHGGSNTTVILDESRAQFTTVTGVTVDRNIVSNGIQVRSTRATAKLSKQSATQWTFDFSQQLLFPIIRRVQYSFEVAPGTTPPRHASLPPNGRSVTVVSDVPVTATVYIEVEQGGY